MNTEDQNPQHGGHDVPLTPPPAPAPAAHPASAGVAGPTGTAEPRRPAGATPIVLVTAIVGGIALLGSGGTAAVAAASDISRIDEVQSVSATGLDSIDLEVGASGVTVEFGDVDEARLQTTGTRGTWTLKRDGDELIVHSPDRRFGWWFGSWFGTDESVVLTLPESLNGTGLDADVSLSAGRLDMSGDFGELDVEVGAGALFIEGSATVLGAEVNAGRAEIELDGVTEADLTVSAGRLVAELTGAAPRTVTLDVSAGSLDLTVPDVDYDVRQQVSAGSLDNKLDVSSRSSRTIDVTVSAGSATLRPGN